MRLSKWLYDFSLMAFISLNIWMAVSSGALRLFLLGMLTQFLIADWLDRRG